MNKTARIATLTALATGALAPSALAAPTAKLETSATPAFNQGYFWTNAGTKVFFNAAHSSPGAFAHITKVEMDLNGNGVYDYSSTNPIPSGSWTFQAPGRYVTIKLKVTNSLGQTDEDSLKLRVNEPPQAAVSVPDHPVTTGQPVLIDASASTDDEAGLSYAFDPESDGTYTPYQSSPTFTHVYTQPGGYVVRTKVRDRFGVESISGLRGLQVNAPDTKLPLATLASDQLRLTGRTVALTVLCPADEIRCTGTVRLDPQGGARFTTATVDLAGGATQTVSVTANKKARKRIRRNGFLQTVAHLDVTDAAGNLGANPVPVTITR